MEHTPITQWHEDDRPREKLLQKGAAALTNAELLAILIQNGTRSKSALDLAKEILQLSQQNLELLGRLTIKEMQTIKGIGSAKAIILQAAMELGRRRQAEKVVLQAISSSKVAAEMLYPIIMDKPHEAFTIMYLNNANKVIQIEIVSEGGITATVVDIKVILKKALLHLASKIILAHNHPSGNLTPSTADKNITQKIKAAAQTLEIDVLDHLIIGRNEYYSFADEGDL